MGRTIEASSIRNFASEGNKSPIESELSPLSGSFALFLPQNNVVSLHPEQSLAQIGGLTASSASDILQQPAGNIAMKENKVDAQTVLVTGGAGYIGSVVVSQLIEVGHKVIVYDNFSRGHPQAVSDPRISVVKGDLADKSLLLQTMRNGDVQTVMHFAAFIEAGESMKKPELYFQNNTANSLNLLVAMLEAHVDTFIFSSTAAVYGTPRKVPIEESAPLEPTNAYGASKLLVENIIAWFHQIHGLRYTSLRYFNACGAAESLGEHHQPESHLIPLAIEAIMGRRPKLYLYGTDYETRDGTCIRDYIHVSDLAEAHLLALNAMAQKKEGRLIYNLGSEKGFTNREVIEAVGRVVGKSVPVDEIGRRPGDPPILVASSEKIRRELGWKPKFTDLEAMIHTAYEWRLRHPDGYSS